jgi:hypothetical protein
VRDKYPGHRGMYAGVEAEKGSNFSYKRVIN